MADLTDLQAAGSTKIVGSDSTGLEQTAVQSTTAGGLHVNLRNNAGTEIGTTTNPVAVAGTAASGSAISGNPNLIGGSDGTNVRNLLVDASGRAVIVGAGVAGTPAGGVVSIQGVSGGTAIPISNLDIAPANGTITAFDAATTSLVGANGQVFYTGTPTANSAAVFALTSISNVTIQANLLGAGGTMIVDVSMDGGTFWLRPNVYQISTQSYTNGFVAPFIAIVNTVGMTHVRVRAITSWAGTATIIARESVNTRAVTIADALPTGANTIGAVTQASGPWSENITQIGGSALALGQALMAASIPVVLASNQSAIPVSQSGTWTTGRTWTLASGTDSVTAAQGTAAALAGHWPVQVTDGTNVMPTMDVVARAGFMKITDGTDTAAVASQGDLKVVDGLKNGGTTGTVTITTGSTPVEGKVGASRLTNRKSLIVVVNAAGIFWGYSNTVTTSTGMPTANGQVLNWTIDPDSTFQVWFCCTTNGKTITVAESP